MIKIPILLLAAVSSGAAANKKAEVSPLDAFIEEALRGAPSASQASPGSLYSGSSPLTDPVRDLKARDVNDLVTILVAERASAVARGTVKTSRQSSVKANVSALGGTTRVAGPWANLAGASSQSQLDGEGATSRENVLTTTLSARVSHALPNGYLVIEGSKLVEVNSERQNISIRGVVRPFDIGPGNVLRSDRIAQMEVRVNGKGVVSDAIRRPFFLYRLLLGLLPF